MIDTDNIISAEQRLFVGVIVNAAQEAAGADRPGGATRTIQSSARAWFVNGGDDFRTVCDFAGLEASEVRKHVLTYVEAIEGNDRTRAKVKRANQSSRVRNTSISDVARHAGVSPTTVRNVLNDRPNVGEAARARVVAAVHELGYEHSVH